MYRCTGNCVRKKHPFKVNRALRRFSSFFSVGRRAAASSSLLLYTSSSVICLPSYVCLCAQCLHRNLTLHFKCHLPLVSARLFCLIVHRSKIMIHWTRGTVTHCLVRRCIGRRAICIMALFFRPRNFAFPFLHSAAARFRTTMPAIKWCMYNKRTHAANWWLALPCRKWERSYTRYLKHRTFLNPLKLQKYSWG